METLLKQPLATYNELGFPNKEHEELVRNLNRNLANFNVHFQKMRNFHWNVKGQNFFDLHAKFEKLVHHANNNIDRIAERVRVFGNHPVSTFKQCLEMADIKESGTHFTAMEMVKETISDFEILLPNMVDTFNTANEIGDVSTMDMMAKMMKGMEKNHWILTSWMSREI